MSLLAGLSQQGDSIAAHNGDAAAHDNSYRLNTFLCSVARLMKTTTEVSRVLFIGDSTMIGTGAGTGGTQLLEGARAQSIPTQFCSISSFLSRDASFFGSAQSTVAYALFDPRVSMGAGWEFSVNSLGGRLFRGVAVSGGLTFTPGFSFDTIEIFHTKYLSGGNVLVSVDGGATISTINMNNAAEALAKTVVTCTAASSVTLVSSTGTNYIAGVVCRLSTEKALTIINGSTWGWKTGDFITADFYSPHNVIATVAPQLSIISLGINDINASVPVATYKTNLATICAKAALSGSVVVCSTLPQSNAKTSLYRDAAKEVANNNGYAFLDLTARGVSYATLNTQGLFYDSAHMTAGGYSWAARQVHQYIRLLTGL